MENVNYILIKFTRVKGASQPPLSYLYTYFQRGCSKNQLSVNKHFDDAHFDLDLLKFAPIRVYTQVQMCRKLIAVE